MPTGPSPIRLTALLLFSLVATPILAQTPQPAQAPPPLPTYTLHKHVREVLTDVTVTDAQGNPVTGLPQSAFHIYDDGHPQSITSFTPHSGNDLAVTPNSNNSGLYSNSYLAHPPAVYNIALIDITTMTLTEQMVLRQQLDHFLKTLPPSDPLAIYMRNGPRIVLVQNFTTSRSTLLAAMRRTIPRFRATGYQHYTDPSLFAQMAGYLSQYPGRKNILWFNGGSNLFLLSDLDMINNISSGAPKFIPSESTQTRALFTALEAERIAIYPIDARGLDVVDDYELLNQQMMMSKEAQATGGKAYFNTNGIAQSARQVLDHSADFYTLTYAPNDLRQNGRWHNVRVRVDGPYHLSYRRGYFDEKLRPAKPLQPITASNGESVHTPELRSEPILFQAHIEPATDFAPHHAPRGTRPYLIQYAAPIADFPIAPGDATHSLITIGVAAIVLDSSGLVTSKSVKLVELRALTSEIHAKPNARIPWQQTIDIPKGSKNVYLAIWNPNSGRLGTLQIPLTIQKH